MDFPHLQNATTFPGTDPRVYEQDRNWFGLGGWRIEGMVNGTPRGIRFYGRSKLGAAYFGEGTEDAAREFLAAAHQDGFFA